MKPPHLESMLHRSLLLGPVAGLVILVGLRAEPASAGSGSCVAEVLEDGAPGSLRACVEAANLGEFDVIELAPNQSYPLDGPLVFERSVLLTGSGSLVTASEEFVGDDLLVVGTPCPGFACELPTEVEIEDLDLAPGPIAELRGIDVLGGHSLLLRDSTVYGFATPGPGACVRAGQASTLRIVGSGFEGCQGTDGGAVFSAASTTVVDGSLFSGNVASASGGAVAVQTGTTPGCSFGVEDSTFVHNSAAYGGAIEVSGSQLAVEVATTELVHNDASWYGGGFYGKGVFSACDFEGNVAKVSGGALYLIEDSAVIDSTVWGNEARTGGGVVFWPTGGGWLSVEGSTFAHNTVGGDGAHAAGMKVVGSDALVLNSTFSENVADDTEDTTEGGGLLVSSSNVWIHHVTFAGNAATFGGGIHADAYSTVELGSSIVAYSTGGDCDIANGSSQTSLDTDDSCGVELAGVDPLLEALADNGGPTWTHVPNEPEAQDLAVCLANEDQRHHERSPLWCDMGAVEPAA